jgi:hypothetical protein
MVNIGNGLPYIIGFRLDGSIEEGDLFWYPQTNATITGGKPVIFSGGNVIQNTTTMAATFAGIAAITQANAGAAGSVTIPVIKPNPQKAFWAPVLSATLVTSSAVGTLCDFDATGLGVSLTSNSPTAYGMQIIDIDASTLAVAANAAGFVKVRFIAASE